MKKIGFLSAIVAAALAFSAAPAKADFYGGWAFVDNYLVLGDSSDGTGLYLANSPRFCGQPASRGSASIRAMLRRSNLSGNGNINWYIDAECHDGYKRVCIITSLGERGCNTYRDFGWHDYS